MYSLVNVSNYSQRVSKRLASNRSVKIKETNINLALSNKMNKIKMTYMLEGLLRNQNNRINNRVTSMEIETETRKRKNYQG